MPMVAQDECQGNSVAGSGKEAHKNSHKHAQASQKDSLVNLDYRAWVSLQAAPVAKAWCSMQVVGMGAAFLRAHWHSDNFSSGGDILHDSQHIGVDALAVAIYISSYCTSAVVLLSRPHLCEVCFVGNTLMRIFLAAIFGLKLLPATATFHLIVNLNLEKLIEVLLMAPIEQVRLSWMVPLRVMLTLGYALVYIHNGQPYPWASALLVNGTALLFQWLMDTRYRKVYAQRGATRPRLKSCGSTDDLQQEEAALAKSVLLGSKAMHAEIEGKKIGQQQVQDAAAIPVHGTSHPDAHMGVEEPRACSFQEPSSSSLGSGSASRPILGLGGPAGGAQVARTSNPLVFRGGHQHKPAGAAAAVHPMDPTTKARLRQVRKCLDRNRPKYTTHFCHHKVSLKIPCNSNPSALASSDLSKLGSLISSSREKEVEVLSAAMRAGCILVVLDLREEFVLLPDGKGGGGEDGLEHALATAAKQWLNDTNLAAEIVEETPVALQVNGSMFLCHLKEGGREWRMQGPIPAALSTGPHPKLTAALPTVVLPASTDMTPPAPSAGGGAAFTATHSAASAAEGEGQQGAHASASAAGKKGQQGGDASASAAGGEGQQVVAAPGSASSSSSSTWVMCNGSSTCMVTADDAGAGHITEAGSAGYGAGHGAEADGGSTPPAAPSQQALSSGKEGKGEVEVAVRVWLHMPGDMQVEGWEGDGDGDGGTAPPAAAAAAGTKEISNRRESGAEAPAAAAASAAAPLSILVRAFDKYLATRVAEVHAREPAAVGGLQARLMEVHVSLPAALTALVPGPLRVELWSQQIQTAVGPTQENRCKPAEKASKQHQLWGQQILLGHCTQLLLPMELAEIATELQSCTSRDSSNGQDFLVDLSSWLAFTHSTGAGTPSSASPVAAAGRPHSSSPSAALASAQAAAVPHMMGKHWALGVTLLRQAVLWGAPALANLVLERLLDGCPSTHNAFAQLAFAHPQGASSSCSNRCAVPCGMGSMCKGAGAGRSTCGFQWGGSADGTVGVGVGVEMGMRKGKQQQMARQGGLLHLALLSLNQHAMLAAILEWGRQWGGIGGKGFGWGWQERNAEGLTPLEIAVGSVVPAAFFGSKDGDGVGAEDGVGTEDGGGRAGGAEIVEADAAKQQPQLSEEARMRAEAGLDLLHFSHTLEPSQLEELVLNLLDPTQPVVSIAAAFEEHQQHQQMQEQLQWQPHEMQEGTASPASDSSGKVVAMVSALPSMGSLASSPSATPAGCSSKAPFIPPPRPQPPAAAGSGKASLQDAIRASLYGFSTQGMVIEEEYRSWCRSSTASLATRFSLFVVPLFIFSAVQSIRKQLYSNAAVMIAYTVPFFMVLLAGYNSPKKREFRMKLVKLTHWSLVMLFGLNILPTIIARKLALTHIDYLVEVFLFRFVDQVQLRALVTERLAQTFALGLFYSSLNMPWPILQAVLINLLSLVVGIALDLRNRHTYMQVCSSSAQASSKAKML